MPISSPPAPFLCVLLSLSMALQRSDLHLVYVTYNSFVCYSCSQDPQPCSVPSLADCRRKDSQLSVFQVRRLTVWFTSPPNAARLLNNSHVRHLTLIHCSPRGTRGAPSSSSSSSSSFSFLKGHFAVQQLERLTVVNLLQGLVCQSQVNRAKSTDSHTDPDRENRAHLNLNKYNRAKETNLFPGLKTDSLASCLDQFQDILLGRELGAAYHEQARLGIIDNSVLEWGAMVKAYTVQTYIDSEGKLPFPDLHLLKLPEASVIYVSFVYWWGRMIHSSGLENSYFVGPHGDQRFLWLNKEATSQISATRCRTSA